MLRSVSSFLSVCCGGRVLLAFDVVPGCSAWPGPLFSSFVDPPGAVSVCCLAVFCRCVSVLPLSPRCAVVAFVLPWLAPRSGLFGRRLFSLTLCSTDASGRSLSVLSCARPVPFALFLRLSVGCRVVSLWPVFVFAVYWPALAVMSFFVVLSPCGRLRPVGFSRSSASSLVPLSLPYSLFLRFASLFSSLSSSSLAYSLLSFSASFLCLLSPPSASALCFLPTKKNIV